MLLQTHSAYTCSVSQPLYFGNTLLKYFILCDTRWKNKGNVKYYIFIYDINLKITKKKCTVEKNIILWWDVSDIKYQ